MRRFMLVAALAAILGSDSSRLEASDAWMPVGEISLEVSAGSPLDFTSFLPNAPIDGDHRLVAGPDGRLAMSNAPEDPTRLLCASLAWSPASGGFPDHEQADRYARQLAMHGYNIARLHFIDGSLMFGQQRDFDFNSETLDRIHYLLAALKRNGIHWIMDGLTSWRGLFGGHDDRWDPSGNLKLALYFDDAAFQHWKRFQQDFLTRVNPYTGIAPIADEALALIILVNENSIEFESVVHDRPGKPAYDDVLVRPFNRWLAKQFGSTAALAKVWPDLKKDERIEDGTVRLPVDRYLDSPRMREVQAFFTQSERETTARMTAVLRDLGYNGLITTFNNWPTVQTAVSRRDLEVVTQNTYHDWVAGYAPGNKIQQTSSLADGVNYLRMIAGARWLGKPFVVTEYDHLFWNRYRYEAGLVVPAYGALQGWDVLCRHGHGPIVLAYGEPFAHKKGMLPYAIALDPVARAGETLAALLFRRGDIAQSKISVPFAVNGVEDFGEDMQAQEPWDLTQLALIGQIGLRDADQIDSTIAVRQPRDAQYAKQIVDELRGSGALPKSNISDIDRGIFQSDTGQITLNRRLGQLIVSTPATEAAAFSSLRSPIDLGMLTIESADGDGLVALSTIDDNLDLAASRRLLLIFATDARNTNMRFRDHEDKIIEDFGRLPVLIRKGQVDLSLAKSAEAWRVSPVGLDGQVYPPVVAGSGNIAFRLSNETPHGPTTYFLLEID